MMLNTHTPHVEPDWAEAFLLELRVRGVSGRRIGAALAEVDAHCAEAGESAREAFGDPETYASALALPASPERLPSWRGELVSSAFGLGGMLTTLVGFGAWQTDTRVTVTTGAVATVGLVMAGSALIARYAEPLLRAVVRRWWVAGALAVVPMGLFVAVLVAGSQSLFTLPAVPTLAGGLLMLVVNTALALRERDTVDDPVVGPEGDSGPGSLEDGALMRGLARLGPWLFPLLTVLMAIPLLLV